MPKIERTDFKKKRGIPFTMKMTLFIAVILGIWGRSCWRVVELENYLITNISLENPTSVSVEVIFDVSNKSFQSGRKNILIEVFTDGHYLIANRITPIEVAPQESRRYVRTIENFNRPLRDGENIGYAKVSLYQRSAF
ncbi:MAG: hypothetical protein FWG98_09255 [Candidatus Cloacimonetes bacterium]|nr:hypothetical protein [Candidatus Cloacimonadota bacterium]